jgi:hypothetical protein
MSDRFQAALFLEKILERSSGVERLGGGSLPFDGGSLQVEVALVPRVLLRDARGYGLGAFEPGGSVKKRALFAAMQLQTATRALA